MHEPKNRRPVALPILRIEIEDANRVQVMDPNRFALFGFRMNQRIRRQPEDGRPFIAEVSEADELVPLSDRRSDISGEPAVLYRSNDLEIALTPAELARLASLNLAPNEFFALLDKFGMAFEWHDDFYDEDTGEALQPRE